MSSTDARPKASRLGHGTMDVRVSLGHTVQNASSFDLQPAPTSKEKQWDP